MLNVALLFASYLLGAIPFGVIVARSCGVDIMAVGSGNIGATNVLRAVGPKAAAAVFILDVLKGLVPTLCGLYLLKSDDWAMFAGIAAVAGHMLSPFLRFRGGKGIATTLGVLIGAAPVAAATALSGFILVVAVTRYVSLGAIVAAVIAVAVCFLSRSSATVEGVFAALCALIVVKHIPNIKRLASGTESKIDFRSGSRGGSLSKDGQK